ncbi:hypothetical protein [Streptomyces sp. AC550_RSS872]|uniref:hypothetical protein n=1 Tax=Streptomyces sp. AC550_RSS872 TaxID=2823689 RepID=UPI001C275398|nr:hypothetical protein [Streptomyces sp. AC550_RSS872]
MTRSHRPRVPEPAAPPPAGRLPEEELLEREAVADEAGERARGQVLLPDGAVLRLPRTGDLGRAYVGGTLVADRFISGRVWDIGRLPACARRDPARTGAAAARGCPGSCAGRGE